MRDQVTFLGRASDEDKAAALRTADVYVAPNTGGESFGIVLVEAMAAGATVLASDLPAFRRVLDDGSYGELFTNGDAADLAARLAALLDDPARRAALDEAARTAVRRYDWSAVAEQILRVYETVVAGGAVMTGWWLALLLVVVLVVGLWLTWTANRLDRMHHRIDVARGTLDAQLLRRSGATLELASSEVLDPPSRLVLLDAAHQRPQRRPRRVRVRRVRPVAGAARGASPTRTTCATSAGTPTSSRWSTSWPATAPGSSWPAASTTTSWSRHGRCGRAAGCAGCGWRDTRPSCTPSTWTTYPRTRWSRTERPGRLGPRPSGS